MSVPYHFWIPLLFQQSLVLAHLDCTYNTFELVSCSWEAGRNVSSIPCYVSAKVIKDKRRNINGFCSLPPNVNLRSCAVNLTTNGIYIKEALTYGHVLNMSVICSSDENTNKSVASLPSFCPYHNLRLDPPTSLDINIIGDIWNLSWVVSHRNYISNTETEVHYKPVKRPWQDAKHFTIKQYDLSVSLRDLVPDTHYEAKVRVNQIDLSGGRWSDWSKPVQWTTPPEGSNFIEIVVAPLAAVGIFLMLVAVIIHSSKSVKKIMWISVPDPSPFFDRLISAHEGNFQKWISCPFSLSSFSLYQSPLDISPLDINWKKQEQPQKFPPALIQEAQRESSGYSGSSFSNQGYFSSIYLAYDHMDHRGFPTMVPNESLPSPTGEDMPLFHADYLCAPLSIPGLGVHNRSFEVDALSRTTQIPTLIDKVIDKTEYPDEHPETSVPLVMEKVSEEEKKEKCEDLKESLSECSTNHLIQQYEDTPSKEVDVAGGYLSLKELNQKHYGHWV